MRGGLTPSAATLVLVGTVLGDDLNRVLFVIGSVLRIVFVGAIILYFAAIGLCWDARIYRFSSRRIRDRDSEGVRTPTMVFAILSLLGLGSVPRILFPIAYTKLGDDARVSAAQF